MQHYMREGLAESIKPIQTNGVVAELTKQIAATQKARP